MASIFKTSTGQWRAQVRRKGKHASITFKLKSLAQEWVTEIEHLIDTGVEPPKKGKNAARTLSNLIDLHIQDLLDVEKPTRRSKRAVLEVLKRDIGSKCIDRLDRAELIKFGKMRTKEGPGPVTLSVDFSYIGTVLTHAAAIHGLPVDTESVKLARSALTHLGLIGRSNERDRRPSASEISDLIEYFDSRPMIIPMARVVRFAIATAIRQEEICTVSWDDVDMNKRVLLIRDRKDPRKNEGNHQKVPLLNLTGFDAWTLLLEQKVVTGGKGRYFPHKHKSVGAAFRRGRNAIGAEDLRFHDVRHEVTSGLFEAGLTIERVALVTGHKDWKMLRRYTNLKPEELHKLQKTSQPSEAEHLELLLKTEGN